MTKSKAAFLLSVRHLFAQKRRVYFWTFTFRGVEDDTHAFKCWNHLATLLRRKWKDDLGVPGVRVVEVHPGGHGLHFHLLVARRLSVDEVRRLAIRSGFGRIHVQKARQNHGEYMAKYLAKSDDGLKRGCRRWGNFGSFKGTAVKDIVIESTLAENCRRVRRVIEGNGKAWSRDLFLQVYRMTVEHGHCLDWPTYPALKERERLMGSDNDLPEFVSSSQPVFDRVRHYSSDAQIWVTTLVPARIEQPF